MNIDIPARLKMIQRSECPRQLSAEQWLWIRPRLCNWLYARKDMKITEAEYYRYYRYLVSQCPRKATHAS